MELDDDETSGMIPRVIRDLFQSMRDAPASVEFTVRCSYIEIYMERLLDLLHPSGRNLTIRETADDGVFIQNASEACCFDEADVVALLVRGNACRTMASTRMNIDSSRSHAIFMTSVEQRDAMTGRVTTSRLQLVDLAGSEMDRRTHESVLFKKGFSALDAVVTSLTNPNPNDGESVPEVPYRTSKLTRLLKNAFAGNCRTTLILTASPFCYNLSKSLNTIRFGSRVRQVVNKPRTNTESSPSEFKQRLAQMEQSQKELRLLIKSLAVECQELGREHTVPKKRDAFWKEVNEVLQNVDPGNDDDPAIALLRAWKNQSEVSGGRLTKALQENELLKSELSKERAERDVAESALTEVQSEMVILRTQTDALVAEKKKLSLDIVEAVNDVQLLQSQKLELEHDLHTSQFRETEATIFLRHFRKFYRQFLHNKAAQGTGDAHNVISKVPGVPTLDDLIDIDIVLYESGLIEQEELNDEVSAGTLRPSATALH
mmetsp:Transcript_55572/g.66814  ORF Transcript_55572/g.66814 Transcript_55572/m.66814 type:complete len:488 (-) Transcript_55572:2117-3580(-)